MLQAAASEPERETAVERQLEGLFRDIGWIEIRMDELGTAALPLLERLRPIAEALHAACHPEMAGGPAVDGTQFDVLAAFAAFEQWFEADRGHPFLQVFERYMPPTPLVEL